jgi:hypothetical protein
MTIVTEKTIRIVPPYVYSRQDITDFWNTPFWGNIPDKPSAFPPSSHSSSHRFGGSDAIPSDDILLRAVKHEGLWWIGNHWLPAGVVSWDVTGSGSVIWDSASLTLSTGTTSSSMARVWKYISGLYEPSWNFRRYLSASISLSATTYQTAYLITGDYLLIGRYIGFKVVDSTLYGVAKAKAGVSENTLSLTTLKAGLRSVIECFFDPSVPKCDFYVDGLFKGSLTTGLPTGAEDSNGAFSARIVNNEAVDKRLTIYEVRLLMEEKPA